MANLSQFPDGDRSEHRIKLLQLLFIVIIVVYALRLFSMQIVSGEVYRSQAQNIARRTTIIPAQRGEIYDQNFNQPMVLNTDSFAVNIIPAEIPRGQIPEILKELSGILGISEDLLNRKVPPQYYNLYQMVELAANVSFETIARLAERVDTLPGVSWQSKPIRNYVDTGSLSHIIGYVGDITRDELTIMYNRGYQQGDIIGKAGIERQYDDILRGKEGREIRTVDARGRRISGDNNIREPAIMGKNLVLSIDRSIQLLAERALGERMGAVVVMRPSNGEILAMVSYPWYDPNIFNRNDMGAEYQRLINDPNKPFLNRAIQSSYPPASAFKIAMTAAILEENAFPPDQTVECPGEITYGDRVWRCHIRKPGHGHVNLQKALAQSCDIYYWVVVRDHLGIERMVSYSREFGFGESTGIDLPGEITGFIPTPQWKDRRFHEKWLGGDTMNMAIGQGFTLVTPIQMANMVAMVVNDGIIYTPHLLKEVRDPVSGAIIKSVPREVLHKTTDIDPEVFKTVRHDMRTVISEGTAQFPLNIKAVEIAGKTGTGEVGLHDRWHSWFAAYAPYETDTPEEQIVVSIIVEATNKWEWWAPYASAIIFQGIFAQQTYEEAVQALGLQYIMPIQERRE
ncbi:penicillin-binding protein 2 [Breznakiella homolactica]|uniref:Penicillin-binding protein 2 n=1 Tax=Breznakiella homolactica TaxID=2798577 RepID=A0A7T7XKL6_9SPIR|nr:penicillin-binding protein 2 [Breznakiella homolactica]QQO08160.1 penicillin-binding protein 2 [Breznakiella homolactica]